MRHSIAAAERAGSFGQGAPRETLQGLGALRILLTSGLQGARRRRLRGPSTRRSPARLGDPDLRALSPSCVRRRWTRSASKQPSKGSRSAFRHSGAGGGDRAVIPQQPRRSLRAGLRAREHHLPNRAGGADERRQALARRERPLSVWSATAQLRCRSRMTASASIPGPSTLGSVCPACASAWRWPAVASSSHQRRAWG